MEAPEEVTNHIVKGKRTKRQRVQSPIPFAALATNSSSGDGGGDDCTNGKISPNWSPTTSNNNEFQGSTEEEEDMANCLILLAQGHSKDSPKEDDDNDAGVYYSNSNNNNNININSNSNNNNNNNNNNSNNKFNSRRFLETASTGSGKVGYYVYECKTCNRTFPSFQALGGHRASHKKPKATYNNDGKKHLMAFSSDEEDGHYKNISSLSLQLSNSNNNNNRGMYSNQNKPKIHECSICGAEFTSGQALGGHMRRHRAPMGTNSTTLSLTPLAIEYEEPKKERNVLSLNLDLNLPAPEDDKLSFASKQQQQQQEKTPLVFSGPALVDCHY